MTKRVLLVMPPKNDNFVIDRIHMGLSLLGQILVSKGHNVKIIDYRFLQSMLGEQNCPDIKNVIEEFKPDVVGISVFTYIYDECVTMIENSSQSCRVPIILGGPHFTFYPDEFKDDSRISYVIRGEAERVFLNVVENAKIEEVPVYIDSDPCPPDEIPPVNLDIAYGNENVRVYQIQLSRGCPYRCSFCIICSIAGRRMRMRDLNVCLDEISDAVKKYPSIRQIAITDDCPNANMGRFKDFLRQFKKLGLKNIELTIDNVRADLLDEEMVKLYKEAGGLNICLGAESGHPEVFNLINKGQGIEEVIRAAKLVHKYNLLLGLCFVIGLPEDTLEKNEYSRKLVRSLKPDYVFWNMCIPWPGTEVRKWFDSNGSVGNVRNFSTMMHDVLTYDVPPCSSPEFSTEDRIKAWLLSNMLTHTITMSQKGSLSKLLGLTFKYSIYWQTFIFLIEKLGYKIIGGSKYSKMTSKTA